MADMTTTTPYEFLLEYCPCAVTDDTIETLFSSSSSRFLQTTNETASFDGTDDVELWKILYTCFVLAGMFAGLLLDKMGADSIMICSVTAFMAVKIISISDGLAGFSNSGLLTVLVLFIVAEGIGKTGALDWYMSKMLGTPTSTPSAQLRLMIPMSIVSGFLNNTPVVAVMIPITQRWCKQHAGLHIQQLLIPLSFASILGGTCTLIGTSTNLVVVGLLNDRYPDNSVSIGLFDLGIYGIPIAMAGMTYILLLSPYLLPGTTDNSKSDNATSLLDELFTQKEILLGARVTPWSPTVSRTVQRSGLRANNAGIYLVSVHRAITGNVHRAVSHDFILNVHDVLYFTNGNNGGNNNNIEIFGEFCQEHGLEIITNESASPDLDQSALQLPFAADNNDKTMKGDTSTSKSDMQPPFVSIGGTPLSAVQEHHEIPVREIGVTKESLLQSNDEERLRCINQLADIIRKEKPSNSGSVSSSNQPPQMTTSSTATTAVLPMMNSKAADLTTKFKTMTSSSSTPHPNRPVDDALTGMPKIIVTIEKDLIVVGVNAQDRPGLLMDIAKGLHRFQVQLHHTEAAVINDDRSVSIWRCEMVGTELPDIEEIWNVMSALLNDDTGVQAMKQRGLRVVRARVTGSSRLLQKTATELNFRAMYKAAIVAVHNSSSTAEKNKSALQQTPMSSLSTMRFQVDDILILQASDDSPLLQQPPSDFYNDSVDKDDNETNSISRTSSVGSLVRIFKGGSPGKQQRKTLKLNSFDSTDDQKILMSGSSGSRGLIDDVQSTEVAADTTTNMNANNDNANDDYFIPSDNDDEAAAESIDAEAQIMGIDELEKNSKVKEHTENAWCDLQVYFGGDTNEENNGSGREFLTAMAVKPNSQLAGQTVDQLGIRKLPDLFLVSIDRPVADEDVDDDHNNDDEENNKSTVMYRKNKSKNTEIRSNDGMGINNSFAGTGGGGGSVRTEIMKKFDSVDINKPLQCGDVLWFAGSALTVGDLRKIPGLELYESDEVKKINEKVFDRRLVQAVIARKSPLVGKTVRKARFRTRYGAAVIAVHREGQRIHEHPGQVQLQAGDVLLLEAGSTFIARSTENDKAFALLAEVEDSAPPRLRLLVPALLLTAGMLAVFMAGLTSLLVSALVASICMVTFGILSEQEARDAINWDIYITIAAAFGIGTAMENSGVSDAVAKFLVGIGTAINLGDAGLLGAVYFATFLISNVVTNNAAAALLFPIALDAAEQTNTDLKLMSYALMLGASASFMSPFGYTTNLLIYGPGGYKYKDFLKFGTPMQVVLWILTVVYLVLDQWYISWLATAAVLILAIVIRVLPSQFNK